MTNTEYYQTLFIGVIIGASVCILGLYMTKPESESQNHPIISKSNFEVVDKYKGCDLVQWSDNQMATYKYFLHCNNTRPVYQQ